MRLHELVDQAAARHALSLAEKCTLAQAVADVVDDGPAATVAQDAELARKLGEVTLHRAAVRIVERRLELHLPELEVREVPAPSSPVAPPASAAPRPRVRREFRCSACLEAGHNQRTCPKLNRRPAWRGI